MQINVTLNLSEKLNALDVSKVENPLAKGWCEIEGAIKFPVRVVKYTDKEDNKEKMFVSFPQKKSGDNYEEIVHPVSDEIRNEVQNEVLSVFQKSLMKKVIPNSHVTDVKVNLLNEPVQTGSIKLMAMSTITLCGFHINGIQVKEGSKGAFIQMPQYKAGNEYHDTVYGTSAPMQKEISEQVLAKYEEVLQEHKEKKQEEKEVTEEKEQKEMVQTTSPPVTPKRHRF